MTSFKCRHSENPGEWFTCKAFVDHAACAENLAEFISDSLLAERGEVPGEIWIDLYDPKKLKTTRYHFDIDRVTTVELMCTEPQKVTP